MRSDILLDHYITRIVLRLTFFTMVSRVSCLTDAEVFFVAKSVQAGRVLSTWVTDAWILMTK